MDFRTPLKHFPSYPIIDLKSKILMVGSCFAEHLYQYVEDLKFSSFLNPCGISFNPISIASSIYYLNENLLIKPEEIRAENERFVHFDFHGSFASDSKNALLNNIHQHLNKGKAFYPPDVLILSLGTSFVYKLKSSLEIVNNCHKVPQEEFEKMLLTTEEVFNSIAQLLHSIKTKNPALKTILTVSPVRHLKDGMIGNNRSKSTLLLACMQLEEQFENVYYFPSYELLLDDLRDYRFYDRDLIHPSAEAVEYILKFFEDHFFSPAEKEVRNQIRSINMRLAHRPFLSHSLPHQNFLKKLLDDIQSLQAVTNIDFQQEISKVQSQIIHEPRS